jgi:hypothetical protein
MVNWQSVGGTIVDLTTAAANYQAAVQAENALVTERNNAQSVLDQFQAQVNQAESDLAAANANLVPAEAATEQAKADLLTAALGGVVPITP